MTRRNCEAGVERLMEYLEGVLPTRMRATLDTHVAGCPRCRWFVASYQATPRIVRSATDYAPSSRQQRALLASLRAKTVRGG